MISSLRVRPHLLALLLAAGAADPAPVSGQFPSGLGQRAPREALTYQPPASTPEEQALWLEFYASEGFLPRTDDGVLAEAYLAILRRWAEGPSLATLDLLGEFEARLDRSDRCFIELQDRNLEAMDEAAPGALAPVLALYVYSWRHHLDRERFNFLPDTVRRVIRWAKWHVDSSPDFGRGRLQAADLLTRLGGIIWDSGYANLLSQGTAALDAALDTEPEHLEGRYLRALIAEKEGRFRDARKDFEALHRQHPDRDDITLHLAVQEARAGDLRDARRRFQSLAASSFTDGEHGPWPAAVAAQEWARLERKAGDSAAARTVLLAGAERHPNVERFELMLAELDRLETLKPSPRSAKLVSRAADAGPGDGAGLTPRVRYLRLPDGDWRRHVLQVERWQAEDRGRLSDALRTVEEPLSSRRCAGLLRDFFPRRVEATSVEAADDAVPRSDAAPGRGRDSAPQGADPPARPQGRIRPATVDVGPDAARPAVGAAGPSKEAIEAELRSGFYVDPDTGRRIKIDMALDLPLRQIYVTPSRFGRRGIAVDPSQVELFDNAKRQDIVTFEQGDIPFTATVLIDASGSMEGSRLERALAGAQRFIDGMASHDRTRLLVASDRLRQATPLLGSDGNLRDHLHQRAEGGTALFDQLFVAVDALANEQGRKVVVVLSDGYDLVSAVPAESVALALRRSQIQLYWVRLRNPRAVRRDFLPPTGWRSRDETRDELKTLEDAIESSGGRVVPISRFQDVDTAFGDILDELRSQIALGYYAEPAHRDGRWRRVEVKTSRAGIRLRHVDGYFDD